MPWEIRQSDGKFCVHKKGEDTPLKCYAVKSKAEAYMKALYTNVKESTIAFSNPRVQFDLEAYEKDPRFLVFKNAILARAEVNANNDEIYPDGIQELASTIAGCPINDEHTDTFIGTFTAGRATPEHALAVDGFIWAVRYPDIAEDVKLGRKGLSVEANADVITCSKCGQAYDKATGKVCHHIVSKRAKRLYGATRQLKGLTSMGGATTTCPAGTDAKFSNEIYMVASKGGENSLADKIIDLIATEEDKQFAETMLVLFAGYTD